MFAPQSVFRVSPTPESVAVGDFNGDGYPDLAVADKGDGTVGILRGSSSGSLGPPTAFAVGISARVGRLGRGGRRRPIQTTA